MKCETRAIVHLVCPKCGETKRVDHLRPGDHAGPWSCGGDYCDMSFRVKVGTDGAYDIDASEEPRRRGIALLKFRDVYLVYPEYCRHDGDSWDYFYHSHQCPTNLLGRVEYVFDAARSDPHGLIRFVAAIDDTPESSDKLEECHTLAELFALFNTDGQPLPSTWPEENYGTIPWIAEMQREYNKKGDA